MKRHLLTFLPALAALLSAAFARGETSSAESLPEPPPFIYSHPLAHATILLVTWLIVAAIFIGPVVYYFVGDLWKRTTPQPFTDDPGHASATPHAAPAHH